MNHSLSNRWENVLRSLEEAETMLRKSTFSLHIGKRKDKLTKKYHGIWSTGFFFTEDGLALTADHNPRPDKGKKGKKNFHAYYHGFRIKMEWVKKWSSEKVDIAVMRCVEKPIGLSIEPLPVAYLDPEVTSQRRARFWRGLRICIYGFPLRGSGQEAWRIDGDIDQSMPLVTSTEVTEEREVRRLVMKTDASTPGVMTDRTQIM